ncbi:hypothetical protein KEJ31_07120 [Candidatus Bathyarchaeota archaeon]|nr:hypothetical protein [Candidatus Bathyarchaeota archaeon]
MPVCHMCKRERKKVVVWYPEKPRILCASCLQKIVQRWLDEGFETLMRALDSELFDD